MGFGGLNDLWLTWKFFLAQSKNGFLAKKKNFFFSIFVRIFFFFFFFPLGFFVNFFDFTSRFRWVNDVFSHLILWLGHPPHAELFRTGLIIFRGSSNQKLEGKQNGTLDRFIILEGKFINGRQFYRDLCTLMEFLMEYIKSILEPILFTL